MGTEHTLVGRVIARGVAEGPAYVVEAVSHCLIDRPIDPTAVQDELSRFDVAVTRTQRHLEDHVRAFHSPSDDDLRQIVAAHLLILNDQYFLSAVAERIERRLMAPEAAVEDAYRVYAARLTASRDDYLRARLEDLRDSCQLIVEALVRGEAGFVDPTEAGHGAIVVSPHRHASAVLRARRAGPGRSALSAAAKRYCRMAPSCCAPVASRASER